MKNIKYDIENIVTILSRSETSDWVKALTRIRWSDRDEYNYDIRNWNIEYLNTGTNIIDTSKGYVKAFSKGITLTDDELLSLRELNLDNNDTTYTEPASEPISTEPYVPSTIEGRINALFGNVKNKNITREDY